MYLHSIWQSSVEHGEDGQVGAQVRNHSTRGALAKDMEAHCPLVTESAHLSLLNTVMSLFSLNGHSRFTLRPGRMRLIKTSI